MEFLSWIHFRRKDRQINLVAVLIVTWPFSDRVEQCCTTQCYTVVNLRYTLVSKMYLIYCQSIYLRPVLVLTSNYRYCQHFFRKNEPTVQSQFIAKKEKKQCSTHHILQGVQLFICSRNGLLFQKARKDRKFTPVCIAKGCKFWYLCIIFIKKSQGTSKNMKSIIRPFGSVIRFFFSILFPINQPKNNSKRKFKKITKLFR